MAKKYLLVLIFFLTLSFVYSLGCCVSSNQQSCSVNSEQSSCEQFGGSFFANDIGCTSQRVCDSGCCRLGLDFARMTRGKCQTETQNRGFASIDFLQTNEDCNKYIMSQELGACIALNTYGKKSCSYISRTQCAGEFFVNVLCTEVQNSNCNKTDNTVCVGNTVYAVDSCGNRDSLIEECKYSEGEVCKQTNEDNEYKAQCVGSSCKDDFDYTDFIIDNLYNFAPTFSVTERKQGETWCVTNGNVPFSDEELNRNYNDFSQTITGASGVRFFSRSCIDGKIVTEACEDAKGAYCSGESDWESEESISGTGGKCVTNDWRGCLSAENEDDCDPANCFWFNPNELVEKTSKKMIGDLEIGKCLPKVSGGNVDSTSMSSICSQGDYETTFSFTNSFSRLTKKTNSAWGNTGLLLGGESSWETKTTSSFKAGEPNFYLDNGMVEWVAKGKLPFIVLNPEAVALLEYRCSRIADCTGKMNFVGEDGRNSSGGVDFMTSSEIKEELATRELKFSKDEALAFTSVISNTGLKDKDLGAYPVDQFPILFGKTSKKTLDMTFKYSCVPRKASLTGDCSLCNKEGNLCSQYTCNSLGSNCEYFDIGGNSGVCQNKGDITPPTISVTCPSSESIGIQQPVRINVETSEVSKCGFSLESWSGSYESYLALGSTWGKNHQTILTVPDSNQILIGDATQYPLLLKSGSYNMYIRCVDPRGNGDTDPPKECKFEVPKTPDKNYPSILKFSPKADTPVLFNTTKKEISMLVNEPSECKWSLKDQDYDAMENEFYCGSELVLRNDVSGFECLTEFTNITQKAGNSTKFYIRCKDQPDLEGEETDIYKRNKNDKSTVYSLKASEKLEIIEVSPKNRVILGPNFADWNLTVKTSGGGYGGITECKWKLNYRNMSTAYSAFSTTQSTFKSQSINQKTEGDYLLSIICADDSGNTANYSGPLEIRYDRSSPIITRIYNDKGSFKITTNEPAICKYTNIFNIGFGCAFTISHPNLTTMVDASTIEHTSVWKKGTSYFVKCQDLYGNENNLCGTIAKAI